MPGIDAPSVLLVDKPVGPTSHDIVQVARRALGVRRIGHTGTLDPFASGLLLLCVGRATRLVEYFHLLPKTYVATAVLGAETDTEDVTGEVTTRSDAWRSLTPGEIETAAAALVGEHEQIPPAYSARKVDGRRSYAAARAGESITLAPKPVHVHSLDILEVQLPAVEFTARVSTGTYVRSLARDLGAALSCGAHLSALRRVEIGPFSVSRAASVTDLEAGPLPERAVLSAARAVSWLPTREISATEEEAILQGRQIDAPAHEGEAEVPVAMVSGERLVAIGRRKAGALRPEKVFP
jgi:tRNA pseudouridine55 synthase